jgi:hypothetical protein
MPRDINGNYSLPPSVNPVAADTLITSNWANTTLDDMATALTDSLTRSGTGGMTGVLPIIDGTLAAPGLSFGNDSNTGLAALVASTMSMVINGVEGLRLTDSGFSFSLTPSWATAPTGVSHLTNKAYVDALAFSTALPTQTGNAGKVVRTDGSTATWQDVFGTSTVLTATPGAALTARTDYGLDSTAAAFSVTLPTSPTDKDWVRLADLKGICSTKNVTVGRNGQNINGLAQDFIIDLDFFVGYFVFNTSYGWTVQ